MLSHTLKSVIKHLVLSNSKKEFEIVGSAEGKKYHFTIYQGKVTLRIEMGQLANSFPVSDIEMLSLPDSITIERWLDTVYMTNNHDQVFEQNLNNLSNDVALFLRLFKVLKERVNFTFHWNDKYYEATYIYGRAYFIDEYDSNYVVRTSDLYLLFNRFPGYQIYTIDKTFDIMDSRQYIAYHTEIAKRLNKSFRVEPETRVRA